MEQLFQIAKIHILSWKKTIIVKKAPPGIQRPSHTETGISGVLYWPHPSVPHPVSDLEGLWGQVHHYDSIIN